MTEDSAVRYLFEDRFIEKFESLPAQCEDIDSVCENFRIKK